MVTVHLEKCRSKQKTKLLLKQLEWESVPLIVVPPLSRAAGMLFGGDGVGRVGSSYLGLCK